MTEVMDNDTQIIEEKCATLIQSVLRMRTIRLRCQSKVDMATVVQSEGATRIQPNATDRYTTSKKDTNVGGRDDVSVCDDRNDLKRDIKSSVGVNVNQQGDEGTKDDVSVGGSDVKGNTINVAHFELDGGAVNGKWSDDAVNTKGVTDKIRCATEERQEGKDAHNGTGDVTVNYPIADINNQR